MDMVGARWPLGVRNDPASIEALTNVRAVPLATLSLGF
jgi:hypothetical protein